MDQPSIEYLPSRRPFFRSRVDSPAQEIKRIIHGSETAPPLLLRCISGGERRNLHATFLVRKNVFAYFLNNHHGDGIVAVACKALPGDNTELVRTQPGRFYLPAYIGSRGWVALRLDTGPVDWEEAKELIAGSYRLVAPKTLAARIIS